MSSEPSLILGITHNRIAVSKHHSRNSMLSRERRENLFSFSLSGLPIISCQLSEPVTCNVVSIVYGTMFNTWQVEVEIPYRNHFFFWSRTLEIFLPCYTKFRNLQVGSLSLVTNCGLMSLLIFHQQIKHIHFHFPLSTPFSDPQELI